MRDDDPALAAMYRAGVVHRGDPRRLQGALRRAAAGLPIIVAAVGASVTSDFGGGYGAYQDRFRLSYVGAPSMWHAGRSPFGWLRPIFDEAAGAAPHNRSALVNCGRAAAQLGAYLGCTATITPDKTDIFIVDAATIPETPARIERTLRRLLQLPHAPAVLLLNVFQWCNAHGGAEKKSAAARETMKIEHKNGSCYTPEKLQQSWRQGLRLSEPLERIGKHYGLPVLSAGAAFVGWVVGAAAGAALRGAGGEAMGEARGPPVLSNALSNGTIDARSLTLDGLHPSKLGSKLLSGLVVHFLREARTAMEKAPWKAQAAADAGGYPAAHRAATAPPPVRCDVLTPSALETPTTERCYAWTVTGWRMHSVPREVPRAGSHVGGTSPHSTRRAPRCRRRTASAPTWAVRRLPARRLVSRRAQS